MTPLSKSGKYFANPSVARMHDAVPTGEDTKGGKPAEGDAEDAEHGHPDIHHIELHPHGDGRYHTVTHFHPHHPEHTPEGKREDHENFQSASDCMGAHSENGSDAAEDESAAGSDVDDEY